MISIIQSHFIARDVIRFWIMAQSNFNDISKYIKYSTSFDVLLLRVTHFPLGIRSIRSPETKILIFYNWKSISDYTLSR